MLLNVNSPKIISKKCRVSKENWLTDLRLKRVTIKGRCYALMNLLNLAIKIYFRLSIQTMCAIFVTHLPSGGRYWHSPKLNGTVRIRRSEHKRGLFGFFDAGHTAHWQSQIEESAELLYIVDGWLYQDRNDRAMRDRLISKYQSNMRTKLRCNSLHLIRAGNTDLIAEFIIFC